MWTAFGLYAGKLIAKGTYQIPYSPDWEQLGSLETVEEKCATYVQMLRLEQNRHPSLHIVPSDEEMYAGGVEITRPLKSTFSTEWQMASKKTVLSSPLGLLVIGW